jgi:hypothetical protein
MVIYLTDEAWGALVLSPVGLPRDLNIRLRLTFARPLSSTKMNLPSVSPGHSQRPQLDLLPSRENIDSTIDHWKYCFIFHPVAHGSP